MEVISNMPSLNTWAGRSTFRYNGSVENRTTIEYGQGNRYRIHVTRAKYNALINHFHGQTVQAGTSRTNPPLSSVGEWLQENVTQTAISSYVCPILIAERYAERVGNTEIRFY
jgi:hypothetical protein